MHAPIVFVTDFGTDDTYAAALAAACWRIDPRLTAIAGMHSVASGDVLAGAYHVKAIAQALPPGSIICAVVDPEVGTDRRAIAISAREVHCVAPDNGLVSYLWAEAELSGRSCIVLPTPRDASATFHGRDVFAPAAARLAAGVSLTDLGSAATEPPRLRDDAFASASNAGLDGTVCVVDHFGNAITTVRESDLRGRAVLAVEWAGGATSTMVRTYAEAGEGLVALLGSAQHLEIAAAGRPAAALGGPGLGAAVHLTLQP